MRCSVVRTISLQTVYECRPDPPIAKRLVLQFMSFGPTRDSFRRTGDSGDRGDVPSVLAQEHRGSPLRGWE
jgi:hypothetical protein